MVWLACPYLGAPVELTDERRAHISRDHRDLLPGHESELTETLATPEFVARKIPMRNELAFVRWFPALLGGRYVVAIVVTDPPAEDGRIRHWIVTAHVARRLGSWRVLWERTTQQ